MAKPRVDLREQTKSFALRIVRMFSTLPKTTAAQVLGKQVLRSGTSIGANYREAFRARSKADADIIGTNKLAPLRQECDELTAIFVTIIKRSKQ